MPIPGRLSTVVVAAVLGGVSWSCSSSAPSAAGAADAEVGSQQAPEDAASEARTDADAIGAVGSAGPDVDAVGSGPAGGDADAALPDTDAPGGPDGAIADGDLGEPRPEASRQVDALDAEVAATPRDVVTDADRDAPDAVTDQDTVASLPVIWSVALPDYVLVAPVRIGPHLIGMSEYAGLDPTRQWEFGTLWRLTNGQISWETPFFPSDYRNIIAIGEDEVRVVGVTLVDGVWVGAITAVDVATGETGFQVSLASGLLSNVAAGADGTLYYSNGGALFAREPEAGDVTWGTVHLVENESVTWASVVALPDGVVVHTAWEWVTKISLDGEILWQKHVDTMAPDCGPIVDHHGSVLSVGNGGGVALAADGGTLWSEHTAGPLGCGVVGSPDTVYAGSGNVLRAFRRGNAVWSTNQFGLNHKTPIIATTAGLLTLTGNGPFAAVRLFDYCGEPVGAWPFPHAIEATPRFMYLTDEGLLVAFDKYAGLLESPQAFELADSPWPVQRGDVWNRHLWSGPDPTPPPPPACPGDARSEAHRP